MSSDFLWNELKREGTKRFLLYCILARIILSNFLLKVLSCLLESIYNFESSLSKSKMFVKICYLTGVDALEIEFFLLVLAE